MVWKCLAPRRFNLGVIDCNRPIRCLRPRDIGVEVFQSQSKHCDEHRRSCQRISV
jgi:hypothetical protein